VTALAKLRDWLKDPVRGRRGPRRGALLLALGLLTALGAAGPWLDAHLRAAGLLLTIVERPDPTGATRLRAWPVEAHDTRLTLPERSLRARRYVPAGRARPPGLVLLHGVHHLGIDEPRLQAFARALAQAGIEVLTPELDELRSYRVEPATIGAIGGLAAVHARALARESVGVVGISFAGGLSLLAAARQAAPAPIAYAVTVGAHHDLARLARFYAGAALRTPEGTQLATRAHPYGARVIVQAHLERFFEVADLPLARTALEAYLHDRFARARELARGLSPQGRERMAVLLEPQRQAELGPLLLDAVAAHAAELARVSPRGQLGRLAVPVFLVHGAGDPIIPSVETRWLAREVPSRWLRQSLISNVLRHAELEREPTLGEYWQLVHFMGEVLREAERH
jgi:pimeloyl-ACP methyl ester carboxylesterase